jgi:hypothetical protein
LGIFLVIAASCEKKTAESTEQPQAENQLLTNFFVKPSQTALYFEFDGGALRQISLPDMAALREMMPWPYAVHVTGMIYVEDSLVITVNRQGFYTIQPDKTNLLAVKKAALALSMPDAVMSRPFLYEKNAAVFFNNSILDMEIGAEPEETALTPFILQDGIAKPVLIPAFSPFLSEEGWEIINFSGSKDGALYFSAIKRDGNAPEIRHLRTKNLWAAESLEQISLEDVRAASGGVPFSEAPALLRELFNELPPAPKNVLRSIRVFSASFGGAALFASGGGDEVEEWNGVYNEDGVALVVSSGGALFALDGAGGVRSSTLPALPSGFVWTAAAQSGGALVAAWEERESWSVGAAGLAFLIY